MVGVRVRAIATLAELESAERLLDRNLPRWSDGWRGPDFFRDRFPAYADLLALAEDSSGETVGTALLHLNDAPTNATLAAIAVERGRRRSGIGRRLLSQVERAAGRRGVATVSLGAGDDVLGFYEACGYEGSILVQFPPTLAEPDTAIDRLLSGPLAGYACERRSFNGWPQLAVRVGAVDLGLAERIRHLAVGASAGHVMTKTLEAREPPDS